MLEWQSKWSYTSELDAVLNGFSKEGWHLNGIYKEEVGYRTVWYRQKEDA